MYNQQSTFNNWTLVYTI